MERNASVVCDCNSKPETRNPNFPLSYKHLMKLPTLFLWVPRLISILTCRQKRLLMIKDPTVHLELWLQDI